MPGIVTVQSSSFDKFKRLVVKCLFLGGIKNGKGDVRDVIDAPPFGIDGNPINDNRAVYTTTSKIGAYYIVGYVSPNRLSQPGETRTFSVNSSGVTAAYIWHKADGTIEMNGSDNFAVKFNELKTEFNKLKTSYNNLVVSYNSHTHLYAPGPGVPVATATTTNQGSSNGSNIDNAKNPKIKTNS